jgi:hypothetical protein
MTKYIANAIASAMRPSTTGERYQPLGALRLRGVGAVRGLGGTVGRHARAPTRDSMVLNVNVEARDR